MKLRVEKDWDERLYRYTVEITEWELGSMAPMGELRHLLMSECEQSERISDNLRALEIIARRIENTASLGPTTSAQPQRSLQLGRNRKQASVRDALERLVTHLEAGEITVPTKWRKEVGKSWRFAESVLDDQE